MRPVNRGHHPLNPDGTQKTFHEYQEARSDLIDRLGQYCSYCEMELDASLAVEHVQPKKHHPELRLTWDNFLLACINCNSTKGGTDIALASYFWPDQDNTFRAFVYREGGIVAANPELEQHQQTLAKNALELTGIGRRPGNDFRRADRRWINRKEAWDKASRALKRLQAFDTEALREQIIDTALSQGYWSVWMTVFKGDADIQQRLIETFLGTCGECFNETGSPIPRPGGSV